MSDADEEFPDLGAKATAAIKGLGLLTGGVGSTLLEIALAPNLETRKREWMTGLNRRLAALEKTVKGSELKQAGVKDEFATVVIHATTIALRNHEREKLEALQNAVVNTALNLEPDSDLRALFISWIDSLTAIHLRVLRGYLYGGEGLARLREDYSGQVELTNAVIIDLKTRGLVLDPVEQSGLIIQPPYLKLGFRVSWIGRRFVEFIQDPEQNR